DTFLELCKLRALRTCWAKLLAGFGVVSAPRLPVHAVCSARTLTVRDPWVNMLRVTTQVFAAVLGGAELVTPLAFDEALGVPSELGRRVARNTGLVLREESALGQVADAAGGSFAFETLTDSLAREAWKRFQAMEREGGIIPLLESGRLAARIAETARQRADQVAKRKISILGVSDFANLDEVLPRPAPATQPPAAQGFPIRRDSWPFEQLRSRAEAVKPADVLLLTLGSFAESRARAGFAASFFSAGGFKTREITSDERAPIVCLCGSDESYAAEAEARAKSLKALGCKQVLLAGRPGSNEAALRAAGVDGFLFLGSDVVATLAPLLEVKP
ncbi:MAG TPA: methylmalonyl-CoA mutase family protein, partial [Myxococcales bacterium]|nr:methylmalonyl-CoA mutase family protein [Myxococcales bacterium]